MAEIISQSNDEVLIQVKVKLSGSFLDMEKSIQDAVNDLGNTATQVGLEKFDTKGQPLKFGEVKMSSKGQVLKNYQTPYGVIGVARHVYQSPKGGATYCPLDDKARIMTNTTPLFAKIISYKYASLSANEVVDDLSSNHRRNVTVNYIQHVADMIGGIAQATEETWDYDLPEQDEIVETVSASLDGTCVLMRDEGYREAMTGNVSLYNRQGYRLHTIYVAAAPEYGKEKFLTKLTSEILKIKKQYPSAKYVGVADGAKSNWEFLEQYTEYQILDFYHATEYLADASYALYKKESERRQWLNDACHQLKHNENAANDLLKQMTDKQSSKLNKNLASKLKAAITYFTNQKHRMNYYEHMQQNLPIGSGVTEAACKVLVKQRLCHSGMKWKNQGASIVLSLRSLIKTDCRWEQFWNNIDNDGINGMAA